MTPGNHLRMMYGGNEAGNSTRLRHSRDIFVMHPALLRVLQMQLVTVAEPVDFYYLSVGVSFRDLTSGM